MSIPIKIDISHEVLDSIEELKFNKYDFGTKYGIAAVLKDGKRVIIFEGNVI